MPKKLKKTIFLKKKNFAPQTCCLQNIVQGFLTLGLRSYWCTVLHMWLLCHDFTGMWT